MSVEKTTGKQISHNLENLKKAGWTVGNTGRARATNYNSKFTMLYRTITIKGTDILDCVIARTLHVLYSHLSDKIYLTSFTYQRTLPIRRNLTNTVEITVSCYLLTD